MTHSAVEVVMLTSFRSCDVRMSTNSQVDTSVELVSL